MLEVKKNTQKNTNYIKMVVFALPIIMLIYIIKMPVPIGNSIDNLYFNEEYTVEVSETEYHENIKHSSIYTIEDSARAEEIFTFLLRHKGVVERRTSFDVTPGEKFEFRFVSNNEKKNIDIIVIGEKYIRIQIYDESGMYERTFYIEEKVDLEKLKSLIYR